MTMMCVKTFKRLDKQGNSRFNIRKKFHFQGQITNYKNLTFKALSNKCKMKRNLYENLYELQLLGNKLLNINFNEFIIAVIRKSNICKASNSINGS